MAGDTFGRTAFPHANLKLLREKKGYSGLQAAQAAGVSIATYYSVERGLVRFPTDATITKLAAAFNITVEALLQIKPNKQRSNT